MTNNPNHHEMISELAETLGVEPNGDWKDLITEVREIVDERQALWDVHRATSKLLSKTRIELFLLKKSLGLFEKKPVASTEYPVMK